MEFLNEWEKSRPVSLIRIGLIKSINLIIKLLKESQQQ